MGVIRLDQLNVSFAKDLLLIIEVMNDGARLYKEYFIKIMAVGIGAMPLIKPTFSIMDEIIRCEIG